MTPAGGAHGAAPMNGSGWPVTADPPVTHPNESPCVDTLFTPTTPPLQPGQSPVGTFNDYSDHPFDYTPPANCPGPYAKVILRVHFYVSKGVQYDRTGAIWVGGTNVFFGTTSEPLSNASPNWDVERDVTQIAPIFANASVGQASVYNVVNSQYTGVIYGTAKLYFYPASQQYPAGNSADAVYPLASGPDGGYVYLDSPSNQMTGTFTFPKNIEAAYLDVFLQGQSNDEFWYTCFPNDLAQKLNNCGGTAFREGEVTVDGQPAGVAPVYPYIFTGGIDPFLWIPIVGVDTLNFKPYHVNLTPFASKFDDGNPHTIAVSVYNDSNYFSANAALLVYEDHGSSQVTGALVSDGTPAVPSETVVENVKFDKNGDAKGTIKTTSSHAVSLDGYVDTSKGRIETVVSQNLQFENDQTIDVPANGSAFGQIIHQQGTVVSDYTTTGKTPRREHKALSWPLRLNYQAVVSNGTETQNTSVDFAKDGQMNGSPPNSVPFSTLNDEVRSSDTLTISSGGITPSNGKSSQQYNEVFPFGQCYGRMIQSLNYVLTGDQKTC